MWSGFSPPHHSLWHQKFTGHPIWNICQLFFAVMKFFFIHSSSAMPGHCYHKITGNSSPIMPWRCLHCVSILLVSIFPLTCWRTRGWCHQHHTWLPLFSQLQQKKIQVPISTALWLVCLQLDLNHLPSPWETHALTILPLRFQMRSCFSILCSRRYLYLDLLFLLRNLISQQR